MFLDPKKDGEQTAKTLEPWRQLLLDAADVMEKRGHCRGALKNDSGAVCLIGALCEASGLMFTRTQAYGDTPPAMEAAILESERFLKNWPSIFSDTHTGPEVIAAMRACAKSCRTSASTNGLSARSRLQNPRSKQE